MNHTGIEKITYGVTDLDKARAFWSDFGLSPVDSGNGHMAFAAQNGASVEIRPADDPELPPPVVPAGCRRFRFSRRAGRRRRRAAPLVRDARCRGGARARRGFAA